MWKTKQLQPGTEVLVWSDSPVMHGTTNGLFPHEQQLLFALAANPPAPGNALCIGCGLLNIPRRLPHMAWTVVDIDPDVISIARRTIQARHDNASVSDGLGQATFVVADANAYVRDAPLNQFDFVYVDAFKPDASAPAFRSTYYRHLLKLMKQGAVLAANVFGDARFDRQQYLGQMLHAVKSVFSHVQTHDVGPNTIVVAR